MRRYLFVFAFSVAVGLAVLWRYPEMYGGDPIVRLTNWEQLRLAYQLPMIQVLVHAATRVTPDPIFLRLVLIVIAALGACGMARLADLAWGEGSGLYAGLLFASNHFLIYLGNSPYQEMLEIALLLWALALVFGTTRRTANVAGYALLAAACLTRYEAWCVAAAAAIVCAWKTRKLHAALPFTIGPLFWIVLSRGFSPAGSSLFDPALRLARLWRIPYVAGATLHHAGSAVAVLALIGAALWYFEPERPRSPLPAVLLMGAMLFLAALPLTSMGVLPDYDRYVTNREAHFMLPLLFLLSVAALAWLRRHFSTALIALIVLLLFAYEGYATKRIMDQSVNEGNLKLDVVLARELRARLGPGESALIFAQPFSQDEMGHFFDMMRRRHGEEGVRAAQESLARINNWPFDYARIWVHAPRLRSRLLLAQQVAALPREAKLAVVFDNYIPAAHTEQELLEQVRQAPASRRYEPTQPGKAGAVLYSLTSP